MTLKTRSRRRPPAAPPAFRRVPLASLRVFAAAAQHLSITRAADALGVTASAVSMQIKTLEDYLRVPLLRRRGRNVELTAEGARLLPRVERGLRELEEAIDAARAERHAGEISITLLASFLQQWLLARLPDFERQNPGLDVVLHTSFDLVDLRRSRMQAAIRMGHGNWAGLHVEKLFDEWLLPVCTAALLDRHGPVERIEDLRPHRLIHSTSEPWSVWLLDQSDHDRPVRAQAFDDSVTVIRAAEAGQGLALARWTLVEAELRAGRLVAASRRVVQSQWSYYFACLPDYLGVEKIDRWRQWLLGQARDFPPPPGAVRSG